MIRIVLVHPHTTRIVPAHRITEMEETIEEVTGVHTIAETTEADTHPEVTTVVDIPMTVETPTTEVAADTLTIGEETTAMATTGAVAILITVVVEATLTTVAADMAAKEVAAATIGETTLMMV